MSRPMLESFASAANMMVRVFAILAAISALLYLLSNWRLQKASRRETDQRLEAERRRADLEAELSHSRNRLDALNAKLEEARKDNLSLVAQLEQEHETRLQIQRRLGPRFLTPRALSGITAALQPFAGQKVNFGYFTELETTGFAQQLLDALKAAGWNPQVFKLKSMQPLYGIECGGPNSDDPALHALADALKLADRHAVSDGNLAPLLGQVVQPQLADQLWILVGLKRQRLMNPHPEAESNQ
ncbi:MAG: hypothetical protein JO340_04770 [Acidobacteriaceae bacterium]|nr:hypothetical protein [Acidobacteriaceae bacterium]